MSALLLCFIMQMPAANGLVVEAVTMSVPDDIWETLS